MDSSAGIGIHLKAAVDGATTTCASYEETYGRSLALRHKVTTQTESLKSLKEHCGAAADMETHFDAIEAAISSDDAASRAAEAATAALLQDLLKQRDVARSGMETMLMSYREMSATLTKSPPQDDDVAAPKAYDDDGDEVYASTSYKDMPPPCASGRDAELQDRVQKAVVADTLDKSTTRQPFPFS